MSPAPVPEIDEARATRFETLALLDGLDQEQLDYSPGRGRWSAGEVVDHLLKADAFYLRELDELLRRADSGRYPFLFRSVADLVEVPRPFRLMLPFAELPFAMANSFIPAPVRRALVAERRLPLPAPDLMAPEPGRPVSELKEELHGLIDRLDAVENERDDNLYRMRYYNPVVGLTTFPSAIKFLANHEKRHQGQLRDVLASSDFPQAA
ncbi:MAG: DinB family protein [Acidobacteriota bacterium]